MGIPRGGNPLLLVVLAISTTSGASAQSSSPDAGCFSRVAHILHDAVQLGHGVAEAPRNAIRLRNLKWELPIAAATGILIARVDVPASNRIQSLPFQHLAARWTNIGLGIELGTSGLLYGIGCAGHRSEHAASTGFTALEAIGAANGIAALLKAGMNRQYPYLRHSRGEFWEGGKSFPSGHAAASFAFASVLSHRYPHNPWVKWGAYALATGVSLGRLAGKKHFPSDVLVGATVGYVTGAYLADHSRE
jgi:membrane-associated phospholipid phosphatase